MLAGIRGQSYFLKENPNLTPFLVMCSPSVLWCFLTREKPFRNHKNLAKFRQAITEANERPAMPADVARSLSSLITAAWAAGMHAFHSLLDNSFILSQGAVISKA